MNVYDPFAHYYDADLGDYAEDLALYRQMAQRTGGPILEIMCGTGRVLLPLAEDGHTLTGVDSSAAMLARAQAKLAAAEISQRVSLIQDDAGTVNLPAQHFAMAFVALNSFMHLEKVKDQFAVLRTLHHTLQRDGVLILDLFNPDPVRLTNEDNRLVLECSYDLEDRHVLKFVANESDLATQLNHVTYMYDEQDAAGHVVRRIMRFSMRWFYRYELEHLLARAGFMLRSVYGSYDLDTYASDSTRLIVIASPSRS